MVLLLWPNASPVACNARAYDYRESSKLRPSTFFPIPIKQSQFSRLPPYHFFRFHSSSGVSGLSVPYHNLSLPTHPSQCSAHFHPELELLLLARRKASTSSR